MDILAKLPKVNYNQYMLSNLLQKVAAITENFRKFTVFYPYFIKDGERPDTIAYDYYGSSDYAWLVLLANQIIDPYYQWPLTDAEFHDYLIAKYGHVYPLKTQISHYVYTGIGGNTEDEIARIDYKMTPKTYESLSDLDKSGWTAVYLYDYLAQQNIDRRQIRLLSNQYLKQVDREIAVIFNDR